MPDVSLNQAETAMSHL